MEMDTREEPGDPTRNKDALNSNTDYEYTLRDYCKKKRISIRAVESTGEDNLKCCKYVIKNQEYPVGFGKTKKEAKREAAKLACHSLGVTSSKGTDFIGIVTKYCQQTDKILNIIQTDVRGPQHKREFCFKVMIGDKDFPEGWGTTKKEAQQKAAELAWMSLQEQSDFDSKVPVFSVMSRDSTSTTCSPTAATWPAEVSTHSMVSAAKRLLVKPSSSSEVPLMSTLSVDSAPTGLSTSALPESLETLSKSMPSSVDFVGICDPYKSLEDQVSLMSAALVDSGNMTAVNYISKLNEHAQRTGAQLKYDTTFGLDYMKTVSMRVVLNDKAYPEGVGNNKKEAKQNAAKNALEGLEKEAKEEAHHDTGGSRPTEASLSNASSDSDPSRLSTPPSLACSSQSIPSCSSDGVIFTESSSSSKDQDSAKNKNIGEQIKEASSHSRFTSEFDSIKCLGKGGFGHVYRARDVLMNDYFAIKIVPYREKVLQEVKALLKLLHSNIVRYYDCWKEDSEHQCEKPPGHHSSTPFSSSKSTSHPPSHYLYIKMELCEMKTLKDWISDKNQETLQNSTRAEESLPIFLQMVCAVECIHGKRFIHRDLKPANIMFGQDGEVKIGDFGLVTTEMDDGETQRERTEETGTPSYMAPEQYSKTYNNKVDIFALGLMYLELLWKMSSGSEKAKVFTEAKAQTLPEDFPQMFPKESKIIVSMLSGKPEERPEARYLRAELEKG